MSILLQVKNLKKSYGPHTILDEANFTVQKKQKIAIIGRNGAGKSTLFKIITGKEKADDGETITFDRTAIGYIQQEDNFKNDDTVISYLLRESEKEPWECAKIAAKFELKNNILEEKISNLSGGYQMRVKLTLMLLAGPNLLLLDEPTNYLDLSTMLLLEKFLISYNGSYLIISHDRRFIKNTCDEIIDIENGKAYHYPGPLESYLKFKQEKQIFNENFNKKQEAKRKHLQKFIDRFGAKASKAAQAKSKAKQIARITDIDIENTLSTAIIKIPKATTKKGLCYRIENLTIGYPKKTIAKNINLDIEKGAHIAILGDNGHGKSTLLKNVANTLSPLSGSIKPANNLRVSYYAQHITSELNKNETVEKYLYRSANSQFETEEIFRMAGNFLFTDDDIKKSISILSGGEKARLCLAGMFLSTNDVLILDEPTNHLDFETAEALALALSESNATILFVSHDRTFTNIVADEIIDVNSGEIKRFNGDYYDYLVNIKTSFTEDPSNNNKKADDKKAIKRQIFEDNKNFKKQLNRIETELEKTKQEKQDILKQYEENPMNTSPELKKSLDETIIKINELENEWLITSEKIK